MALSWRYDQKGRHLSGGPSMPLAKEEKLRQVHFLVTFQFELGC